MQVEFDPAKSAVNLVKHGVSLAQAEHLDWDALVGMPDSRREYGEYASLATRLLANGCIALCLQIEPGCDK